MRLGSVAVIGRAAARFGAIGLAHGGGGYHNDYEGAPSAPAQEDAIRSEELATALAQAALEKKAYDLVILDMHQLVSYTDTFVLCTANNRRQVQAIADNVRLVAKREHGRLPEGVEGMEAARWVLVDFGDVVVHVFDGPLRGFYNLDGLWSDAPRLPAPEAEEPPDTEAIFQL